MRRIVRNRQRTDSEPVTRRAVLSAAVTLAAGAASTSSAPAGEVAAPGANLPPNVPEWQMAPGAEVMSPALWAAVKIRGRRRPTRTQRRLAVSDAAGGRQPDAATRPSRRHHAKRLAL